MLNECNSKASDVCSMCKEHTRFKRTRRSFLAKTYKHYVHLECKMNKIQKYNDTESEGEFFTLDLGIWEEIDNHWIDENRIGVGRLYNELEAKVFIQIGTDRNIRRCKNFISFSRDEYLDVRKQRGEGKHKNLRVSKEGTIWIGDGYYNKQVKVYIKRGKVPD